MHAGDVGCNASGVTIFGCNVSVVTSGAVIVVAIGVLSGAMFVFNDWCSVGFNVRCGVGCVDWCSVLCNAMCNLRCNISDVNVGCVNWRT